MLASRMKRRLLTTAKLPLSPRSTLLLNTAHRLSLPTFKKRRCLPPLHPARDAASPRPTRPQLQRENP